MFAFRWRAVCLLSSVALMASACGGWKPRPSGWSNATGAEQFERLWWHDVKAKKWDEVGHRLAATYISIGHDGVRRDREQTLAHLRQLEVDDFALGDVDVRPNGDDLVISYTMSLRGRLAGAPITVERAPMLTVWQRQKTGWMAIVHANFHESEL